MGIYDKIRGLFAPVPAPVAAPEPEPVRHADGWENPYNGLGTARDTATAGNYRRSFRLMDPEISALFHGDDIAARIIDFRPKEAFREGYELALKDKNAADPSKLEGFETRAADLEVDDYVQEAWIQGRAYGGALLILGVRDFQTVDQPLEEERIRSFDFLNVIDRRYITPSSYYTDPNAPKFGRPETYRVTNVMGGGSAVYHESRVIRFGGSPTDTQERLALGGWDYSILQRPYDKMRAFNQVIQAAQHMMGDASQGVFKVKELLDILTSKDQETFHQRMQLLELGRGVARAILVDADTESFEKVATSFAGVPDILDRFMMLLSSACGIPVAILMGRSAAGMNATGDADFRAFYDSVKSEQNKYLAPKLRRIYRLMSLARTGPSGGRPLDFEFKFCPLWQLTGKEQADLELVVAQKDQIYITNEVATPEEIAATRFAGGTFNPTTSIDVEARQAALAKGVAFDPYTNDETQSASAKAEAAAAMKASPQPTQQGGIPGEADPAETDAASA